MWVLWQVGSWFPMKGPKRIIAVHTWISELTVDGDNIVSCHLKKHCVCTVLQINTTKVLLNSHLFLIIMDIFQATDTRSYYYQ